MNKNKAQTFFKTFHKGYTRQKGRGMVRGDVVEKLGCIRVQVFKYAEEFIAVRSLKEILGNCGFYVSEGSIRRITREGSLKGRRWNGLDSGMWYYIKRDLYDWVDYLIEVGERLLVKRRVIREEKVLDLLIGSRKKV